MNQKELVEEALVWVRRMNRNPAVAVDEVSPETDLLGNAVLDSIGLVELLVHIENRLGRDVELEEADPSDFVSVSSICSFALRHVTQEGAA